MGINRNAWFLHMDDHWMYRVCLASESGHIVVQSQGYFRLEDAQEALDRVTHSEVVLAQAA